MLLVCNSKFFVLLELQVLLYQGINERTYDELIVGIVRKDESERHRLTSARSERHSAERH